MLAKEIKTPMIIGLILCGVAVLINLIITLGQSVFLGVVTTAQISTKVIPSSLFVNLLILIMFGVFLFVMLTNKDDNRRTVGIVMTVFYLVFRFAASFAGIIEKRILVRKGVEFFAALSSLESLVSMVTSPFLAISTVLVVIAIARYGISDTNSNFQI